MAPTTGPTTAPAASRPRVLHRAPVRLRARRRGQVRLLPRQVLRRHRRHRPVPPVAQAGPPGVHGRALTTISIGVALLCQDTDQPFELAPPPFHDLMSACRVRCPCCWARSCLRFNRRGHRRSLSKHHCPRCHRAYRQAHPGTD